MKGFIVYSTYKIFNDQSFVCLFGRLENNETFLTINKYEPYFYVKSSDAKKMRGFKLISTKLINFDDESVTKVIVDLPQDVSEIRKDLEEKNIECYEADIKFVQRFLMDKNIKSTIYIDGDYTTEEAINRVYREPELKPAEFKPNLKILSIDIEADLKGKEIYCIGLYTNNYKKCIINSNKKLSNVINCDSEEEVLEKFKEELIKIDPDIITGWNLIDFDLQVIFKRVKHYGIEFNIGRDNSKPKLRIEKDFLRSSKAEISGRQVLDGIDLMKHSFIKFNDYKLGTVAQHFLGETKSMQFEDKGEGIKQLYLKEQQKFVDYNLKDAELVYKILEKSGVIDLAIQKSLLTGLTLDKTSASIASLDSLYIREANQRGIVCPSGKFVIKENPITGAYVMQPTPGIYDNVILLDFKSLYPSLMITYNLDPFSYTESGKNLIKAPNGATFQNQDGIMPIIIKHLWAARDKARKNKNELERHAVKILMNSFYGVLASPSCRFFNLQLAGAITAFSQFTIKKTAELIEKKGYKVIYADTDSCFVVSNAKSLEQANKIGEELKDYINDFYEQFTKKEFNRKNYLELEYEKCYTQLLMPKLRHQEKGAKKRYAGLVDNKLEFTGLETVRSDWTDLAKKFQQELYMLIFHKKDPANFIKDFVEDTMKGKYDKLLVYKKSLRKEIEGYEKTTPPHVKAARKLDKITSTKIEYVITTDGPEPIQNIKHAIDYNHYIDKQIKPIADSILTFFNTDFEKVMQKTKQTSLFNY